MSRYYIHPAGSVSQEDPCISSWRSQACQGHIVRGHHPKWIIWRGFWDVDYIFYHAKRKILVHCSLELISSPMLITGLVFLLPLDRWPRSYLRWPLWIQIWHYPPWGLHPPFRTNYHPMFSLLTIAASTVYRLYIIIPIYSPLNINNMVRTLAIGLDVYQYIRLLTSFIPLLQIPSKL